MAGVTADSVVILLEAQIAKYQRDMEAAAKKTEEAFARIRSANKPVNLSAAGGGKQTAAERDALRTEQVIQREAAKTAGVKDRLAARSADVAEKAEARKAAAAEKAAQRGIAAAEKQAAAEIAASERAAASAATRTIATPLGGGKTQAQYEAELARHEAAVAAIPPRAAALSSTSLSSGNVAGATAVNGELAEQLRLRAALVASNAADTAAIQDQLFLLKQINGYKAAGLAETEAIAAADADLVAIETRRTAQLAEQTALQQKQLESQIAANGAKVSSGISGITASLIGVGSIAEISHLNDEYIKFSNSLKIAGVNAADFNSIQSHLLATASRTGAGIGQLGDLFRSTSLASHDLGASQQQILKVTDAVANSLKITGASGGAARAAILQLGHTFESTRVTAREFNSLQLNAYPILQAVAAGSDKYGGSVGKLRAALISTGISNKEFFADLLNGAHILEGPASKAVLTTSQGFSALNSALIVYFGSADQANGISATFGAALGALARNLDILVPAIAAVGVALTVGYVTKTIAAITATQSFGAAILSAFGGPVGLAVSALVLTLGYVVVKTNEASVAAQQLNQGIDAQAQKFALLKEQHEKVAAETNNLSDAQRAALTTTANLTGEANLLATAWGRVAVQAKQAAIAQAQADLDIANSNVKKAARAVSETNTNTQNVVRSQGAVMGVGGFPLESARSVARVAATPDRATFLKAQDVQKDALANLQEIQNRKAVTFKDTSVSTDPKSAKALANAEEKLTGLRKIAETATGKRLDNVNKQIEKTEARVADLKNGIAPSAAGAGVGGGRSGPSAETLEKRRIAEENRKSRKDDQYDRTVADINASILSAKGKQAKGIEDTYKAALDDADASKQKRDKDYQDLFNREAEAGIDKKTIETRKAALEALSQQLTSQQKLTAATERNAALADQAAKISADKSRNDQDAIKAQIDVTKSRARREQLTSDLITKEYEARKTDLDNQLRKATADNDTAGIANIKGQQANLPAQEAADRYKESQNNRSPYQKYRDDLKDTDNLSDQIDNIKIEVLDQVADSLANATTKALGLTGALGDIVGQIIKIGIQRRLIGPIADGLFGKADGSSSGGFGNILSSILGGGGSGHSLGGSSISDSLFKALSLGNGVPTRASGGNVSAGKIYRINENGPEYFQPASSGNIIPTGRARGGNGGGANVTQYISVDGRNSVTPAGFASDILRRANSHANQAAANAGKAAYQSSPQRQQKLQQLGS